MILSEKSATFRELTLAVLLVVPRRPVPGPRLDRRLGGLRRHALLLLGVRLLGVRLPGVRHGDRGHRLVLQGAEAYRLVAAGEQRGQRVDVAADAAIAAAGG